MAIIGVGMDAIELSRIEKIVVQDSSFIQRVLTPKEYAVYETLGIKRKVEYLAGRFAAKEAYSKALGTGIGKAVSFQDIQILNAENGQPLLTAPHPYQRHVSITHTNHDAYAVVILEETPSNIEERK